MYGSQLWGNARNSTIDIVQRAQSKILRTITGNIHSDLNILPVKEVIAEQKEKYFTMLSLHRNHLARGLTRLSNQSRLRRNDGFVPNVFMYSATVDVLYGPSPSPTLSTSYHPWFPTLTTLYGPRYFPFNFKPVPYWVRLMATKSFNWNFFSTFLFASNAFLFSAWIL